MDAMEELQEILETDFLELCHGGDLFKDFETVDEKISSSFDDTDVFHLMVTKSPDDRYFKWSWTDVLIYDGPNSYGRAILNNRGNNWCTEVWPRTVTYIEWENNPIDDAL